MRRKLVALLPLLVFLPSLLGQNKKAKDEGWSDLLPPGEGRELVLNSCTSCQSPLFTEEIEPSTSCLSMAFGPAVPKLVNVNTVARENLETLPKLKPDRVTRILKARDKAGRFKNSEELRRALEMEKPTLHEIFICSSTAPNNRFGTC